MSKFLVRVDYSVFVEFEHPSEDIEINMEDVPDDVREKLLDEADSIIAVGRCKPDFEPTATRADFPVDED